MPTRKIASRRSPIRKFRPKEQRTAFLRNEFRCRVEYLGRRYYSVAHALLAARSMDKADHRMIAEAVSFKKASSIAAAITFNRPLWSKHRTGIMLGLLESKFSDPMLARQLLDTGDQPLVHEGPDPFWDYQKATRTGQNMLGQLLMLVRDNLRAGRHGAYSAHRRRETARIRDWRRRKREERERALPALVPLPYLPWHTRHKGEGIELYYKYGSKVHVHDPSKHGRWTPNLEREIRERVAQELDEAAKAKVLKHTPKETPDVPTDRRRRPETDQRARRRPDRGPEHRPRKRR